MQEVAELQKQIPPCKVGDIVYRINVGAKEPIIPLIVSEIRHEALKEGKTLMRIICSYDLKLKTRDYNIFYYPKEIGKKIFLSKEAAEQALKEIQK